MIVSGIFKKILENFKEKIFNSFLEKLQKQKVLIDFPRYFNVEKLNQLKSNELLNILLYYIILFKNLISEGKFEILNLISEILKFVLTKRKKNENKLFEEKISNFKNKFQKLYKNNCNMNFHNLNHLSLIMNVFGSLLYNNCYIFENINSFIKEHFYNYNNEKIIFKIIQNEEFIHNFKPKNKKDI